jgi:tripartite-type tricarboxylate transporter receptor subunit TctC
MKLVFAIMVALISGWAQASEVITIVSPYSPTHSGTVAMQRILEQANQQQNRYNFILDFRPGGEQILAIRYMDENPTNRLAIIAPKYVEHVESGRLNRLNYEPVWALGDACWAVITNVGDEKKGLVSLRGQRELVVGGVGIGNTAHLTALEIGQRMGFQVRYVPFRSNFDALMLMASDGSVNMVLERVTNYQQMKLKNPNLQMLAMSCPQRHPDAMGVATLIEQGFNTPYVFNIVIANRAMPAFKQQDIADILNRVTANIGVTQIQQISDMRPPHTSVPVTVFYNRSVSVSSALLKKYADQLSTDQTDRINSKSVLK